MTQTFYRTRKLNRARFGSTRGGMRQGNFNRNGFRSRGGGFGEGRKRKTMDPALLMRKAAATVVEPAPYVAQHSFADFAIDERLKQNIATRGYTTPTPIQDQAIPQILTGKDVVGIANTGTGKTAAFLIPLINKILKDKYQKVLIVAPTRELAVQILDECRAFSGGLGIYSVLCIGGVGLRQQIDNLRRNPHIVIGTPGRLKDLKNQGKLLIAFFSNIVLDEVDRMLDMGFVHDVRFIISHLPRRRQSLFFSATINPQASEIISQLMTNPITISVKKPETAHNVDQDVIRTQGRNKLDTLHALLRKEEFQKVLIFGRTKWGIDKLEKQLSDKGILVSTIHGNKRQSQRQRALGMFKDNKINVLLATDVASRGLDIPDVTHVINFDLPETYDDYIHRIGRTGRAGKKGTALSFID